MERYCILTPAIFQVLYPIPADTSVIKLKLMLWILFLKRIHHQPGITKPHAVRRVGANRGSAPTGICNGIPLEKYHAVRFKERRCIIHDMVIIFQNGLQVFF
jgi:hypothetical protein